MGIIPGMPNRSGSTKPLSTGLSFSSLMSSAITEWYVAGTKDKSSETCASRLGSGAGKDTPRRTANGPWVAGGVGIGVAVGVGVKVGSAWEQAAKVSAANRIRNGPTIVRILLGNCIRKLLALVRLWGDVSLDYRPVPERPVKYPSRPFSLRAWGAGSCGGRFDFVNFQSAGQVFSDVQDLDGIGGSGYTGQKPVDNRYHVTFAYKLIVQRCFD